MLNPNNTNDKTKEKELKGEKKKIADLTSKLTKVQNYSDLVECLEKLRKIANERSQFINFISLTRSKKKGMYGCKTILNKEFGKHGENIQKIKDEPNKIIRICTEIKKVIQNTKRSVLDNMFTWYMDKALKNIQINTIQKEMQELIIRRYIENQNRLLKLLESKINEEKKQQAKEELILVKNKLEKNLENLKAKSPKEVVEIIINQTKQNEKILNNMTNVNEDDIIEIKSALKNNEQKSIKKIKKWDVSKHWKFTNWVTGHGWKNK